MVMPARTFTASNDYRYGFNGKEKDKNISSLTAYDYGFRIYNPAIGKFLSVDPLTGKYPELTPYQFASNRPIDGVDLDGKEYLDFNTAMYRMGSYTKISSNIYTHAKIVTEEYVANVVYENIPSNLKDSKNGTFKYVDGGPITTLGRDYTGEELSKIIFNRSQYFHARAQFYGAAESDPPPTPVGASQIDPTIQAGGGAMVRGIGAGGSALGPNGLGGIVLNQINASVNNDFAREWDMRRAFYNGTNVVNYYLENEPNWKNAFDNNHVKPNDLINFITDGYLDISGIANYSGQHNSSERRDIYRNALNTAYLGLQMIQQLNEGGQKIKIHKGTQKNIETTIKNYIAEGGGNEFDNISKFYK